MVVAGRIFESVGSQLRKHLLHRRAKSYKQMVHTLAQHGLHLYLVSYKHIVRVQYQGSVQVYVGIRVESVHFQYGSITAELMFVHDKRCAIHPVFVFHPLHGFLVHAVKGIRYSVVVQQVLMYGAGHFGFAP